MLEYFFYEVEPPIRKQHQRSPILFHRVIDVPCPQNL